MSKAKVATMPDTKDKVFEFAETLLMGILISNLTASLFAMLSLLFLPPMGIYGILKYPTSIVGILGAFIGTYIYKKRESSRRSRSFYTAIASLLTSAIASAVTLLIVLYLIKYAFPVNI